MIDSSVLDKEIQEASEENILSSFQEDLFNRNQLVVNFVRMLSNAQGPLSVSLDGPWGSGKTFFVKQAKMFIDSIDLEEDFWKQIRANMRAEDVARIQDMIPVYYDAWQNDNDTDPILSILYSIVENDETQERANIPKKVDLEKVKKSLENILCLAADTGINPLASKVVKGVKGLAASWTGPELFSAYKKQQKANKGLRSAIEGFFVDIRESYCSAINLDEKEQELGRKKIIVFIDELDRCRPDFAVRLLERVKHYADLPNVIFIMSTNLAELQYMIRNVYGDGFGAARYLDRFFDIHMMLPEIQDKILFKRFNISSDRPEDVCLRAVVSLFKMSLREIYRYLKWYKIAQLPKSQSLNPDFKNGWNLCKYYIFPYMIALKLTDLSRYQLFISGNLKEAEAFASFITEIMPHGIMKNFFPNSSDSNDTLEKRREDFIKEIERILTALWHTDALWNTDDEMYKNECITICRSYGTTMMDQLSLLTN